jgi:non-specific serine/threonine protein kinase
MTGLRHHEVAGFSYRFGAFELDTRRLELRRDGSTVEVEPKPLEVLAILVGSAGELVSKNDLMESVWGGRIVTDYVITRCINKLRAALDDAAQTLILSVYGQGYRFTGAVSRSEAMPLAALVDYPLVVDDSVPQRPHWHLEKPLDEAAGVWLAVQQKTGERRVFKFALRSERVPALKRELSVHRLLKAMLGERGDFVRLIDFNLEVAPYFLELDWCAQGNLADWLAAQGGIAAVPLAQRLELLAQAADSLAAAHAVGVLHLDVKPANMLVWTDRDGRPHIRWSDFGSSRLLDPERLAQLGITRMGPRTEAASDSGTPMYLAPEVMAGRPPTALSDIHALGVVLYQLGAADLNKPLTAGWERDVEDALLREDIAAAAAGDPALRLGSATELARRIRRREERRARDAAVKSREREAAALALRLERIRARRPWLAAASLALVAGLAASIFFYAGARSARNRALAEAQRAEAVSAFLENDLIGSASPYAEGNAGDITVREALDRAAAKLDGRFPGQPLTEAQIHFDIATLNTQLDRLPEAEEQARKAWQLFGRVLGPQDPHTLSGGAIYALDLIGESRFADAGKVVDALAQTAAGIPHPDRQVLDTVDSIRGTELWYEQRYAQANAPLRARLERALADRSGNVMGPILLRSKLGLDDAHLGRFDEAGEQYRIALAQLAAAPALAGSFAALTHESYGVALFLMGRYGDAERMLRAAHSELLATVGARDQATAESDEYRGLALLQMGRTTEALQACRQAYEALLGHYGADSHYSLMAQGHLGLAELAADDKAAAEQHLRFAADHLQAMLGWASPAVQNFRSALIAGSGAQAPPPTEARLDATPIRQESPAKNPAPGLPPATRADSAPQSDL